MCELQPYEVNLVSRLLDTRIVALRKATKTLPSGTPIKVYTPTNIIHGTLMSTASVYAIVKLTDGSEHKIDMATITPV